MTTFVEWFEETSGQHAEEILLEHAFTLAVCRIESAVGQDAADPIACLTSAKHQVSRVATKKMFGQLGYTPAQIRIVQRLLAGSTGGWPGLLRLYLRGEGLDAARRSYVARQFRLFRAGAAVEGSSNADPTHFGLTA